ELEGVVDVVRARPGHERHARGDLLLDELDHGLALLARQGARLARRAGAREPVAAVLDLELDEPLDPVPVDSCVIALERPGEREDRASRYPHAPPVSGPRPAHEAGRASAGCRWLDLTAEGDGRQSSGPTSRTPRLVGPNSDSRSQLPRSAGHAGRNASGRCARPASRRTVASVPWRSVLTR